VLALDCPYCSKPLDYHQKCSECGYDLKNSTWVVIKTVYPPEDAILESLIQSFGIPVRLIRSTGSVIGVAVGPLGEVKIAVPEVYAEKAVSLLQAELEQPEIDRSI
jgi:hypothetical protein